MEGSVTIFKALFWVVCILATKTAFAQIPIERQDLQEWLISFSNSRVALIQQAIQDCVDEFAPQYSIDPKTDFCIYSLGSLSVDVALPQSDFEFGILVNKPITQAFWDSFLSSLQDKLNLLNISFDQHEMTPQFYQKDQGFGTPNLCSSLDEIVAILTKIMPSWAYLLYFTKYIYGDPLVYESFVDIRSTLNAKARSLFIAEIRKSIRKNYGLSSLYKLLDPSVRGNRAVFINFKKQLFRQIVDFINYLSFIHQLPLTTPFHQIQDLQKNQIFLPDEGEKIHNALLYVLENRRTHKDRVVSLHTLSPEEMDHLKESLDVIFLLTEKTKDAMHILFPLKN